MRRTKRLVMRRLPAHQPPTHPGEMLLEEFLEPLGISQSAFAVRLGVSFPRLNAFTEQGAQTNRANSDPAHPEHESSLTWVGGSYDPDAFDPAKVVFEDPLKRFERYCRTLIAAIYPGPFSRCRSPCGRARF